ncbi:MAG: GntG family PLP-dependent aldolase [Calditrichota bacterium]
MIVDLRSDTLTKPSPEMRRAMAEAEVGDDVFGEDPTVNRLQELAAEILGKESALFMPSGSMANQAALGAHTQPGDEVICEASCHIRNYEGGAPAALSGVMLNYIEGRRGSFTAEEAQARLRPNNSHYPASRLIWIENSSNRAGGAIFPQSEIHRLRQLADENRLALHLDGARIWNVSATLGISEKELAAPFDSVNACLSKGLGCPVGSLTAGSQDFIKRVHRLRKRFGGGMRQAGILAAAGIYALAHNRERLNEDHAKARRLAEAVADIPLFTIDRESVQTNIVIFQVKPGKLSAVEAVERLRREGILGLPLGASIRFVTHLDVDDKGLDYAVQTIHRLFKGL